MMHCIVHPTVIARDISDNPNYDEIFGPIAFVHRYSSDDELSLYFQDKKGRYMANKMYVSLYVSQPRTVVHKTRLTPVNCNASLFDRIEHDFRGKVIEIFGHDNVVCAFIFGSVAKKLAITGKSDIDTFVCLKARSVVKERVFIEWSKSWQKNHGFIPDNVYPSEIVTLEQLEEALSPENLEQIHLSLDSNAEHIFDTVIWAQIINDKKLAFVGGSEGGIWLSKLAKNSKPFLRSLAEQVVNDLSSRGEIKPELFRLFPDVHDKNHLLKSLEEK